MKEQIQLTKKLFKYLSDESKNDQNFMENFLIPHLGLNDEFLHEQPTELSTYYGHGLGLKIWQYPHQISKYLILLNKYSKSIKSYAEIGCRNGGTFILHCEYLNHLSKAFAIDIIEETDTLKEYRSQTDYVQYMQANSQSNLFKDFINSNRFDLIFIDGDHSYSGVKSDAEITRESCNIQVFHDIVNDACPGVGEYWEELKLNYNDIYEFYEFTDQYDSVDGTFLGIGVAVRKKWITI